MVDNDSVCAGCAGTFKYIYYSKNEYNIGEEPL